MLVTVSLGDHETRCGNRKCQVEVGKYCSTKQHIHFTPLVVHLNWWSAADTPRQYLTEVLIISFQ